MKYMFDLLVQCADGTYVVAVVRGNDLLECYDYECFDGSYEAKRGLLGWSDVPLEVHAELRAYITDAVFEADRAHRLGFVQEFTVKSFWRTALS